MEYAKDIGNIEIHVLDFLSAMFDIGVISNLPIYKLTSTSPLVITKISRMWIFHLGTLKD